MAVDDKGNVTQLNLETKQATVFNSNGNVTTGLKAQVDTEGKITGYTNSNGNDVILKEIGGKDPSKLGPEIGLGKTEQGSAMLSGLDSLNTAKPGQVLEGNKPDSTAPAEPRVVDKDPSLPAHVEQPSNRNDGNTDLAVGNGTVSGSVDGIKNDGLSGVNNADGGLDNRNQGNLNSAKSVSTGVSSQAPVTENATERMAESAADSGQYETSPLLQLFQIWRFVQ